MGLSALVARWEQSARRAFWDAESEADPMGKRLIEHGAMCYFNCAQDLKEYQASLLLPPLSRQEENQT